MVVVTTAAGTTPKVLLISGGKPPAGSTVSLVLPAPSRRSSSSSSSSSPCGSPEPAESAQPLRKRQRLTHLSPEEKALRRKLKNRVAAQTARDRKKARMSELEQQVIELELENQKLHIENSLLNEQTHSLMTENKELRQRLGLDTLEVKEESKVSPLITTCASAAGAGPAVAPPQDPYVDTDNLDSSDSESDLLLGILDGLYPEMFLRSSDSQQECLPEEMEPDIVGVVVGEDDPIPASPSPALGAPSVKLEAINELIRFDHVYTKPLLEEGCPERGCPVEVKVEEASLCQLEEASQESPVPTKLETSEDEGFMVEVDLSNFLHIEQDPKKPGLLLDTYSDSGYEGSPSPFSDMSSPLGAGGFWEDTFANELFPQLISV
ncbi:X-box-binding protein 1 [Latimeria chalumnae]|uniref:X-box-binding protein 1 n=1 Tax=Latimeria chalumnae TaxID=7897 RepID=UPI00313DFD1D